MMCSVRLLLRVFNIKFTHHIIFFSFKSVFFCNFATAYASKVSSCKKSIAIRSFIWNSPKFIRED